MTHKLIPILAPKRIAARAAGPDPIYALIDVHRRADKNFSDVLKKKDVFDQREWIRGRKGGHPILDQMEAEACDLERDALMPLLELPATTVAGLVAAIRYLESTDCDDLDQNFLENLAAAIERVTS